MIRAKVVRRLPLVATGVVCTLVGLSLNPTYAEAATITQTLPEFDFDGESPFPNTPQTIGTYSFSIPTGEQIVSAVISGTFGNSSFPNTAPVQVFLDGLNVATCSNSSEPCYFSQTPTAWSFTFNSSQFALLSDGIGVLTSIQTDQFVTRLGETTLTIETAPTTPIPTPALLPGLIGMGVAALRKRKAAVAE